MGLDADELNLNKQTLIRGTVPQTKIEHVLCAISKEK